MMGAIETRNMYSNFAINKRPEYCCISLDIINIDVAVSGIERLWRKTDRYLIFIVPCIVIFYGITNICHNVQ